jgi:hypothetical protein
MHGVPIPPGLPPQVSIIGNTPAEFESFMAMALAYLRSKYRSLTFIRVETGLRIQSQIQPDQYCLIHITWTTDDPQTG